MGWLFNKKKSSDVAKDRLKLVLIYDRAGTTANTGMIDMMKKDILEVISKYVVIDENEFEMDFKNIAGENNEGISSQLVANIPIVRIKQMTKNVGR